METYTPKDLRHHISKLKDPRIERNKRHSLLDIIMIVLSAIICKIDGWEEIEEWAKLHEEWLATFLELANGVPSHDTCGGFFNESIQRLSKAALPNGSMFCASKPRAKSSQSTARPCVAVSIPRSNSNRCIWYPLGPMRFR